MAQSPEGFVLVRSRDVDYPDHVGVREEYRDEEGRLLVHLLGISGEMGEGSPVAEEMELLTGKRATLFGTPEKDTWSLVWRERSPCRQTAIVGNGFTRDEFVSLLEDSRILPGPS